MSVANSIYFYRLKMGFCYNNGVGFGEFTQLTFMQNYYFVLIAMCGDKVRTKSRTYNHILYYLKDVIRNDFSLQEKEVKKEKLKIFSNVLEFINALDNSYDLLKDIMFWGDKINNLMSHFVTIVQTLNEKMEVLIKTYLD